MTDAGNADNDNTVRFFMTPWSYKILFIINGKVRLFTGDENDDIPIYDITEEIRAGNLVEISAEECREILYQQKKR